MAAQHAATPQLAWAVADMTSLVGGAVAAGAFDVVIYKGAMDAVLADGADKWEAPEDCLAAARAVCEGVAAALAPGGVFLQLTFSQRKVVSPDPPHTV